MEIRAANFADAPQLFHCVVEAFMDYIPLIGQTPGPMLEDYCVGIEKHHTFVAEEAGELLGLVLLKEGEGGIMWLDVLATYPQKRSRGAGRALIAYAEAYMRGLGKQACHIYTHVKYTRTIGIYQSLGYEIYDRVQEYGFDRYYLRKDLRQSADDRSAP